MYKTEDWSNPNRDSSKNDNLLELALLEASEFNSGRQETPDPTSSSTTTTFSNLISNVQSLTETNASNINTQEMGTYSWPGTDTHNIITPANLSNSPNLSYRPAKYGAKFGTNSDLNPDFNPKSKSLNSSQPTVISDIGSLTNPGARLNSIGTPLEHQPGRDNLPRSNTLSPE